MIKTRYVSLDDIPAPKLGGRCSIKRELDRFASSNESVMEVLWKDHYKTAYIASHGWRIAIERVFIVKTTAE